MDRLGDGRHEECDEPGKLTRLREQARKYVRGEEVQDAELPILLDMLLKRYPGYGGVDALLAEDAEYIDAFLVIAEEEGKHQEEERRKVERESKQTHRRR